MKGSQVSAIEEVLVNAVYHRAYNIREPIEVRVNPDSIMVLSFPGPDRSVDLEKLNKGTHPIVSRKYRNRRIGEFLKELELTEGRSTGIPKVFKAMRLNGSPDPIFESDEERSYFLVTLPAHPLFTQRFQRLIHAGQVTGQVEEALLQKILLFCQTPKKASEIQRFIGIKHRETFLTNYL